MVPIPTAPVADRRAAQAAKHATTKGVPAPRPQGMSAAWALRRDRRGTVAVTVAIGASALLGAAALATDVGNLYLVRRNMQSAVDAAAIAAARGMAGGADDVAVGALASDVAARNGFQTGTQTRITNVDVAVLRATSPRQVTVTVQQTQPMPFVRAMMSAAPVVTASATAVAQSDPGGACVLSLSQPIAFAGNSNLQAPNCGLSSNYRHPDSLRFGSGGSNAGSSFTVRVSSLISSGGCTTCTAAEALLKLAFTRNRPAFYQADTANPYASITSQGPALLDDMTRGSACASPKKLDESPEQGIVALPPGCYTSMSVTGGRTLQLSPGIYVVSQGNFSVSGGSQVNCPLCTSPTNGVTIAMVPGSGNKPSDVGAIDIQANAIVNLSARSTTADPKLATGLDGVLFYRDGRWPAETGVARITIQGGPAVLLRGAIVGPTTNVELRGGPNVDTAAATNCMAFVVRGMTFQGGSGLDTSGCTASGVRLPSLEFVKLAS
ncbi:pilus assembly protein TadG-related protein [Falsiroseomonas tokyonensis]|uniref:Pilus assembly protein TadG-related protein n=1 Tax=Falsiroseomonas tokyonensis TaxID=430521 RepID=A0ABV7BRS3_9PROT|nr:pilus assembly protein TadG-related protein [Falsiroseomonas tokyonensis]MBU8537347.1 hypothetical protein [Falsiroseomonas tokyonensis]